MLDYLHQLDGLSAEEIAEAAKAAAEKGLQDRWLLPLLNTTQQPALLSLRSRQTRENLFAAGWTRNQKGDDNDTRELLLQLVAIRAQKAELLGAADYASWSMADQMAGAPAQAFEFMRRIAPAARARAEQELADIQQVIDDEGEDFTAAAWDWPYYAEQVRRARFAIDEAQLKPYFALDRVLLDGVFWTASQLFGLRFVERFDIPVYHPDVRVWEIFDANGAGMALFYGDYYARDSKSGGAWMDVFVEQSTELRQQPVIYNVCNYQKPGLAAARYCRGMKPSPYSTNSATRCTGCSPASAMPACREPIPRAILSSFRRKSLSTGPASRRYLPTTRVIIKPEAMPDALREHVPGGEV